MSADKEKRSRHFGWEKAAGPFFLILALSVLLSYQVNSRNKEELTLEAPLPAASSSAGVLTPVRQPEARLVEQNEIPDAKELPTLTSNSPLSLVININTATLDELIMLPAIGEVKAKAILEYRMKNGPFRSVDALLEVKGIGEKTLEKLKDLITVE